MVLGLRTSIMTELCEANILFTFVSSDTVQCVKHTVCLVNGCRSSLHGGSRIWVCRFHKEHASYIIDLRAMKYYLE